MHYVKIPPAIAGIPMADGKAAPFAFAAFLLQFSWTAAEWRKDNASVEAFLRLTAVFGPATEGSIVELLDADYERLERVVREAHAQFAPVVVIQLMTFVHAVTGAKTEAI